MNALKEKVIAQNRANSLILDRVPRYQKALQQFIGRPILKTSGQLLAEVKREFPEFPVDGTVETWFSGGTSTLFVNIRVSEHYAIHSVVYQSAGCGLASLGERGLLVSIPPFDRSQFRTDFTVSEIQEIRDIADRQERDLAETVSRLDGWGRY